MGDNARPSKEHAKRTAVVIAAINDRARNEHEQRMRAATSAASAAAAPRDDSAADQESESDRSAASELSASASSSDAEIEDVSNGHSPAKAAHSAKQSSNGHGPFESAAPESAKQRRRLAIKKIEEAAIAMGMAH